MNLKQKISKPSASYSTMLSVDRALHEFRRGRIVHISDGSGGVLAITPEMVSDQTLSMISALSNTHLDIAITHHRARTLKVRLYTDEVVLIPFKFWKTPEMARVISDPIADMAYPLSGPFIAKREPISPSSVAAIQLAKIAQLLPSAIVVEDKNCSDNVLDEQKIISVDASAVMAYELIASDTLQQISSARVPLEASENCRILTFRSPEGGREHLAFIIGEPNTDESVLARLHSECFTGDLLGSLKCDCGQQLRGAIAQIESEGAGILLYLRQEGRGIGLVNKLRAYTLQDQGYDTVEANERLGFESDDRLFLPAVSILRKLGFRQVRLMTNNPEKVEALRSFGVEVAERVPHAFPSNDHNQFYLSVKKEKSGHFL